MQATKENKIVVTRHKALIDLLIEDGIIEEKGTQVIAQATEADIKGRHVVGILPLHLACLTISLTTVDLNLLPEQRGKELSLTELRQALAGYSTYTVNKTN